MSKRKKVIIVGAMGTLVALYLLVGILVKIRIAWCPAAQDAGMAYLQAIRARNIVEANRYSESLGPLLDVMESSNDMHAEQKKAIKTAEFDQWKKDFLLKSRTSKPMERAQRLVNEHADLGWVENLDYHSELVVGNSISITTFEDTPGEIYHEYYKISYPSVSKAAPVSVLEGFNKTSNQKIKSIVLHLEVRRRPTAGKSFILSWDWLESLAFLYSFVDFDMQAKPYETWMVGVRFKVDRSMLELF